MRFLKVSSKEIRRIGDKCGEIIELGCHEAASVSESMKNAIPFFLSVQAFMQYRARLKGGPQVW